MQRINWNNGVTLRLTPKGLAMLRAAYADSIAVCKPADPDAVIGLAGNVWKTQLWVAANILGPGLQNGFDNPCEMDFDIEEA